MDTPGGPQAATVVNEFLYSLILTCRKPEATRFKRDPGPDQHVRLYPFLEKLFADGGYQRPQVRNALANGVAAPFGSNRERIRQRQRLQGPATTRVERAFPWLNRWRRLAKDFENPNRNDLAFIQPASISNSK